MHAHISAGCVRLHFSALQSSDANSLPSAGNKPLDYTIHNIRFSADEEKFEAIYVEIAGCYRIRCLSKRKHRQNAITQFNYSSRQSKASPPGNLRIH